jgi:hypothetical protein
MRAHLRRVVAIVVAATALTLGAVTISAGPAAADPICPLGTDWDGIRCR